MHLSIEPIARCRSTAPRSLLPAISRSASALARTAQD